MKDDDFDDQKNYDETNNWNKILLFYSTYQGTKLIIQYNIQYI